MNRILHKELIPSTDVRLGRHIFHDSLSKNFTFDTSNIVIADVEHARLCPVLNQLNVGSCTGNAGVGCINTSPHVQAQYPVFQPTEDGARALYSAAECVDGDGPYPPNDHGSSGLSIVKALTLPDLTIIASYQHTFTLQDALKALTVYPIMIGINWYTDMFNPDPDGRVHPTGTIAGGHEIYAYKLDVENGRIWCCNSWGSAWGVQGTFYLTWADFETLLLQGGDVTIPIPLGHNPLPIVTA